MPLIDAILDLSRQKIRGELSPWFGTRLREQIDQGLFLPEDQMEEVRDRLIRDLVGYREQAGISTAVLGMSGGVDSALTAALLKQAGWRVIGFTLPIEQDPEETERGVEACEALGLEHHHLDLTAEYQAMAGAMQRLDAAAGGDTEAFRTRRGNIRARLRMVTLYDQAHRFGGLVASTDNFSELGAGFWTLHGDVGDLAPVQSLLKSWEVPWMARACGVPERTWRAKPTDGLGIGGGDEAQIGASYLEWDIMVFALIGALGDPALGQGDLAGPLEVGDDAEAQRALAAVERRLRTTWHKRVNPIRLGHPKLSRFAALDALDARLFRPSVLDADEAMTSFSGEIQVKALGLARALEQAEGRLVTAESLTAGLLAAAVAGVPGASGVLEGSFVTYCATLKTDALGVSAEVIAERTVYDAEVARQMARGALEQAPSASLALSLTGVAGPGPDQGVAAGTVFIGVARRGGEVRAEACRFDGPPQEVIAQALVRALELGREALG